MPSDPIPGLGFLLGGMAACGAVTFSNPMEVVKTRMQLEGELRSRQLALNQPRLYPTVWQGLIRIARYEGLRGLQKGLLPAYCYQLTTNGVRFGGYDALKSVVMAAAGLDPAKNDGRGWSLVVNLISGGMAGMTGALIGSPFFLIKTRLQSYSEHGAVGTQHYYRNMWDGLRSIYQKQGFLGLYSGAEAAMIRTGIGSAAQLATYDRSKYLVLNSGLFQDNFYADFASAMISGLGVTVAMNPFDVVSTRMYNQNTEKGSNRGGSLYKNPLDCIVKTVKAEGPTALYKGFLAHYLRIGPHTVLCFVFLEQLKRFARSNDWLK